MKRDLSTSGSEDELLLGEVLDDFSQRVRAGEQPDVDEYVARYPALAGLRELLATVGSLEGLEPSTEPALPGLQIQRLGDYRIERELGRGGMGVVFLAYDEKLDRKVALKLLPLQATLDKRFLQRFEREARAAANLSHPNIVPVFGVGEHDGIPYYAMQYVDGHPLDLVVRTLRGWEDEPPPSGAGSSITTMARGLLTQTLSGSGWSPGGSERSPVPAPSNDDIPTLGDKPELYHRNVAKLTLNIADALAYAHSHGVLHRDVKPANLLLSDNGRIWITDFGLCKTADTGEITLTTDFIGTLRYMAPEQIDGRSDVRSDVYELGATLYELMTLHPMFGGRDRGALVRAVVESHPPRPRRIRPDIPRDLEAICLKATAKLPEERYGTAAAFAEDLRAFLDGRAIAARPPSALQLFRLIARRNRRLAAAAAIFVSLFTIASVLYLVGLRRAGREQDRQLYLASLAAARAGVHDLERAPGELRNWEWHHYAARVDNSLRTIAHADHRLRGMDVDGAGRWAFFGEDPSTLRAHELVEPYREWSLEVEGGAPACISASPDGSILVTAGYRQVHIWSLEVDEPVLITSRTMPARITALARDANTGRIYIADETHLIRAFDGELENELFTLHGHEGAVVGVRLLAEGTHLVSCSDDETVRIWDLETLDERVLRGQVGRIVAVDASPDGAWIAAAGANNTIQLWNARSGVSEAILSGHTSTIMALRFAPDGRSLASSSADQSVRIWEVATARPYHNARPYRPLWGHAAPVEHIEFLPDGRLVSAAINGEIKEWDPNVTGGFALLEGHVGDVWNIKFDSSGDRLLTTGRDATVRVWDVAGGRISRVLFGSPCGIWSAAFTPDGDQVAAGHRDGVVRLWDIDRGEIVEELSPPLGAGEPRLETPRLVFHPSGRWLYVSELSRGVVVWEKTDAGYRFAERILVPGAFALDISRDGRHLAIGTSDGRVVVLDTSDLEPRFEASVHTDQVQHLCFEPSGDRLFSAGFDGLIAIWRVSSGELLRTIRVEDEASQITRHITGLGVWPDGSRVACATEAHGVTVWDTEHGDLVATLRGPARGYLLVDVSPNGRRVACGSWDGPIRLWDTLSVGERRADLASSQAAMPAAAQLVEHLTAETGGELDRVLDALLDLPVGDERREAGLSIVHAQAGSGEGLLRRLQRILRRPDLDPRGADEARALAHGLNHRMGTDRRVRRAEAEALLRIGDAAAAILRLEPMAVAATPEKRDIEAEVLLAMAYSALDRHADAAVRLARARAGNADVDPDLALLLEQAEQLLAQH